jgi:hypothetical protein
MNALARASSNRDRPILSSERMLYKGYNCRYSIQKIILAVGLGAKRN